MTHHPSFIPHSPFHGFTLVELIVVTAVIATLSLIAFGSYNSISARARDTERKEELKQIANSLELFFDDHQHYPPDANNFQIAACPFYPGPGMTGDACDWDDPNDPMTDGRTIYMGVVPGDRTATLYYRYEVLCGVSSCRQSYRILAHLENPNDADIDDALASESKPCGDNPLTDICNYGVSSANAGLTGALP